MPDTSNSVTIKRPKNPATIFDIGRVLEAHLGKSYTIAVDVVFKPCHDALTNSHHLPLDLRLYHNNPGKPANEFAEDCKQLRESLIQAAKKHGLVEMCGERDVKTSQDGLLAGRAGTLQFYDPAVTYKTKTAAIRHPDTAANAFAKKAEKIFEDALASMQTPAAELETSAKPAKLTSSKTAVKGA